MHFALFAMCSLQFVINKVHRFHSRLISLLLQILYYLCYSCFFHYQCRRTCSVHQALEPYLNLALSLSPSLSARQTLFNPNKTVVKMFVVMYDLRAMPAGHQTFLRQRTFSVPVRRDANNHNSRKPFGHGRTLRYLIHLR